MYLQRQAAASRLSSAVQFTHWYPHSLVTGFSRQLSFQILHKHNTNAPTNGGEYKSETM